MDDARRSGTADEWSELLADLERSERRRRTSEEIEADVRWEIAERRRLTCDVLAPPTEPTSPWAGCSSIDGSTFTDPKAMRAEVRRLAGSFLSRAPRDERVFLRHVLAPAAELLDHESPDQAMDLLGALASGESIPDALRRLSAGFGDDAYEFWGRAGYAADEEGDREAYSESRCHAQGRELAAATAVVCEWAFASYARFIRSRRWRAAWTSIAARVRVHRTCEAVRAFRTTLTAPLRPMSHAPPGRRFVLTTSTAHGPPVLGPLVALDGFGTA